MIWNNCKPVAHPRPHRATLVDALEAERESYSRKPEREEYPMHSDGAKEFLADLREWRRKRDLRRGDYFDVVWSLREEEMDKRQKSRERWRAHYRPILTLRDDEWWIKRQTFLKKMGEFARLVRKASYTALILVGVVWVALTVLTVSSADAGDTTNRQGYTDRFLGKQKTYAIRNSWEQGQIKVGDIYDPGVPNRPLQIRNNQRQIIGTIDRAVPRDEWEEYYE